MVWLVVFVFVLFEVVERGYFFLWKGFLYVYLVRIFGICVVWSFRLDLRICINVKEIDCLGFFFVMVISDVYKYFICFFFGRMLNCIF